ncbi:hypothetical protein BN946_scf184746.g8 [Trametes cinnabarina]|uniref:RING-type domain-containing protein n=1 Tax=Pycnoporus cinnabarinus TaxID=5643 RepID=A0A060S4I8_PYCCI|nr:hypothetical protein BN946_scf184746.g8 [Trametes cinnabarina]
MPPLLSLNPSSNRRSTASARQRENRPHSGQQPSAGPTRRRKSRSPEARLDLEASTAGDSSRRKKRPSTVSAGDIPLPSSSGVLAGHEGPGDRGRARTKTKSRPQAIWVDDDDPYIVTNIAQELDRTTITQPARSKRKERSRSLETMSRHTRKTATTPDGIEDDGEPMYTGPLAQADYHRMKQEVEALRKQVAMAKKTIHKQSKVRLLIRRREILLKQAQVIDELRIELTSVNESRRTQCVEMEKLKVQSKKSNDLVSTVESNLTCQVCMELLLKPYGLSPCGHVLCMTCLLEWFRSAPPGDDNMLDDDHPNALLYRKKTCPCCRTVVLSRPIPLYLVKSLASAVDKSKAPDGVNRPSPPPDEEDPWAGIFREPSSTFDDYWSTDEDDEDEDDEDAEIDDGYDDEDEDDYWSFDGYGSGEDEERYDGPYVSATWAPPSVHVSQDDYPFLDPESEEFKMLRRGATLQMIQIFRMSYSHRNGLAAIVEDENVIYLGWNLELHPDDETGEEYIDWVLSDMYDRPERWRVVHDAIDGTWTAHKLVPQYEAEGDYDNSDSEMWTAEEDSEDEMM